MKAGGRLAAPGLQSFKPKNSCQVWSFALAPPLSRKQSQICSAARLPAARPIMQQSDDPRRRTASTRRMQSPQVPRAPPSLPPPPSQMPEDLLPAPPVPDWLKDQAYKGPLSRRDLFLVAGTAAGLVGFKIWQGSKDSSDEPEVGNRAGLPAVEMPSGRREPNGSLRPSSSTAKRRGPVLNWLDGRLYVESKSGAVFSVLSTQEPGYIVLHSQQTDRWYSLPVELDAQVNTQDRSLMAMLFAEDWESMMREFKVKPRR